MPLKAAQHLQSSGEVRKGADRSLISITWPVLLVSTATATLVRQREHVSESSASSAVHGSVT